MKPIMDWGTGKMSKTTITLALAFVIVIVIVIVRLMIRTSGIPIQKIVLEKRWAEDVMSFDIEFDLLVLQQDDDNSHLTLRG